MEWCCVIFLFLKLYYRMLYAPATAQFTFYNNRITNETKLHISSKLLVGWGWSEMRRVGWWQSRISRNAKEGSLEWSYLSVEIGVQWVFWALAQLCWTWAEIRFLIMDWYCNSLVANLMLGLFRYELFKCFFLWRMIEHFKKYFCFWRNLRKKI